MANPRTARNVVLVRTPGQVTEFPADRVRLARGSNADPQPYYDQNRVVLKRVDLNPAGGGMQISGEVFVDFDCDRAPGSLKLPSGPIMGLELRAELYMVKGILRRIQGAVEVPEFDAHRPGIAVPGQSAQCTTTEVSGGLALARFQLPSLARPLAPGVYHLIVSLDFGQQDQAHLQAIQWCSDFWGKVDEGEDPQTQKRSTLDVLSDSQLRSHYLREVLKYLHTVESVAIIYLSDTLVQAGSASPKHPNAVVWDPFLQTITELERLQTNNTQLDADQAKFEANEELIQKRLEAARAKNPKVTRKDIIDESRKLTAAGKKRVDDLIKMSGGKASKAESDLRASAVAGRAAVLEQIKQFQDYLTQRYWVLVDGYLPYAGWHTVNKPGYNTYDAVANNNNKKDAEDRNAKIDAIKAQPGGLDEMRRKRNENWKYYPKEITDVAFSYLERAQEQADFDSKNFTKKSGGDLVLDVGKWADYRAKWMAKFLKDTQPIFDEVDTSVLYANQVWPDVLAEAKAARDDVISNAFAWEFQIRTATGEVKEDAKTVVAEWTAEDQANPALGLQKYIIISPVAPGSVKQRFDGRLSYIKSTIKLQDFIPLYRQAIDAQAPVLPGTKPVPG
ncbi:MAG: hypothetical protein IPP14_01340 [Planctomycetes bacterium]|nr:hypothetical protein [Planctomycetota bacterium]